MAVERLLLESGDFLLQEIGAGILLESSDIDTHPASGGRGRPFAEVPTRTSRGTRRRKIQVFEQEREREKVQVRDAPIQAFTDSLRDVAEITALKKIQQFEQQELKVELARIDQEIVEKEAVQRAVMIANLEFDLKMTAIRRREEELILIFIIRNVL